MQVQDEEAIGIPLRDLWTISEVSEFLNVPVGTLYQWRHRGTDRRRGGSVDRSGTTRPLSVAGWSRPERDGPCRSRNGSGKARSAGVPGGGMTEGSNARNRSPERSTRNGS